MGQLDRTYSIGMSVPLHVAPRRPTGSNQRGAGSVLGRGCRGGGRLHEDTFFDHWQAPSGLWAAHFTQTAHRFHGMPVGGGVWAGGRCLGAGAQVKRFSRWRISCGPQATHAELLPTGLVGECAGQIALADDGGAGDQTFRLFIDPLQSSRPTRQAAIKPGCRCLRCWHPIAVAWPR
jgi:hypothetical protein